MRRLWILAFFVAISGSCWADDFFNPPPMNPELPPWMQQDTNKNPNTQPQNANPNQNPNQPNANNPPTAGGAPQATPDTAAPAPEAGTGDEETDEASPFDFGGDEGGGGGGGGRDQGKSNFLLTNPSPSGSGKTVDCFGWGSSFIGTTVFTNETACQNELDLEVEKSQDAVDNYVDHAEKEVLRGVIRGKIPREKSKDFHLEFASLKDSLLSAQRTGCRCLE